MKPWCWLMSLVYMLAGGIVAAEEMPVDLTKKPAYWREPRLELAVGFTDPQLRTPKGRPPQLLQREPDGPNLANLRSVRVVGSELIGGRELAEQLTRKTGVRIVLQGDWAREGIVVPDRPTPARELMDSLARAFNGRWFRQGTSWVLAQGQQEARLSALTEEERSQEWQQNIRTLLQSFRPEQWKLLSETGKLEILHLTGPQRQAVRFDLMLTYYDPDVPWKGAPGPEAMQGKGVTLGLSGTEPRSIFHILGPPAPGLTMPYLRMFDLVDENGKPRYGVVPPR